LVAATDPSREIQARRISQRPNSPAIPQLSQYLDQRSKIDKEEPNMLAMQNCSSDSDAGHLKKEVIRDSADDIRRRCKKDSAEMRRIVTSEQDGEVPATLKRSRKSGSVGS